ncbi:MAG: hypothetical protein FJ276_14885 [Planctomycetes bacterium]|nr:hypothetical protein [Planctomycetota bacterium]
MRKNDFVFLLCVAAFAGLIAARSISQAIPSYVGGAFSATSNMGSAGNVRQVDMARLRFLLEQKALSDHEAEFYEPSTAPRPAAGPAAPSD